MASEAVAKVRYIDGTHSRVHPAGTKPAGGPQAQAMGKTNGGRISKLMLMVDLKGRPVAMLLVPGRAYEGRHVVSLSLTAIQPLRLILVGDMAYDDGKLRFALTELGFKSLFHHEMQSRRKSADPPGPLS